MKREKTEREDHIPVETSIELPNMAGRNPIALHSIFYLENQINHGAAWIGIMNREKGTPRSSLI
jgi:hypothetical protein